MTSSPSVYTCSSESSSGVFTDSSDSSETQEPRTALDRKPSFMVLERLFNFEELSDDEESEGEVFEEPLAELSHVVPVKTQPTMLHKVTTTPHKVTTMPRKVTTMPRKVTTMPRKIGQCDLSAYDGKSRDLPTDTKKSQSMQRQAVAPNRKDFRPRSMALDSRSNYRKLTSSHSEPRFSPDKLAGNKTLVCMRPIPEMEWGRERRATYFEIATAHQPLQDIHISSPQLQPQAITPTTGEEQAPKKLRRHPAIKRRKSTLGADKVIKTDNMFK